MSFSHAGVSAVNHYELQISLVWVFACDFWTSLCSSTLVIELDRTSVHEAPCVGCNLQSEQASYSTRVRIYSESNRNYKGRLDTAQFASEIAPFLWFIKRTPPPQPTIFKPNR